MKPPRCCFHLCRCLTVHWNCSPNTSCPRRRVWRSCGSLQKLRLRPFGPCRSQSLWMKVLLCTSKMYELFHHRPIVHIDHFPNTSPHRCQGWRRSGSGQQIRQRPFDPCRGQSLWMKVRWCPCWFHRRPTVRSSHFPNISGRRCQGWRRCGRCQQKPQRLFVPFRGQSRWLKVRWCSCSFHHRPIVHCCPFPNISGRRYRGWRRHGTIP